VGLGRILKIVSYLMSFSHKINQSKLGEDSIEKEKERENEKNTEKKRSNGKSE
jgi:hypothetical protein